MWYEHRLFVEAIIENPSQMRGGVVGESSGERRRASCHHPLPLLLHVLPNHPACPLLHFIHSFETAEKDDLQLAFECEGGGGGGSCIETTTVTTSSSHLYVREVVVGGSLGVTGISSGWRKKEQEKTGNDICHCPFSRCTAWASHFMGPPSRFSTPNSLLIDAHIPLKRGGVDAAGVSWSHCKLRESTISRVMCRNVTHSHVILFAQTLFWFDFF